MVRLHVKKGDESQFLYDASVEDGVDSVINNITIIYNGRLKISRICYEIEELAKHGTMLPHDMMGLTDEQIEELKLKDEWAEKSTPMGGWTFNKDVIGRRSGRQPNEKMQEILKKAIQDARAMTSKKLVQQDKLVTQKIVQEALDILRGAVTIVYPMGLPPHDVIRQEFENNEDLTGTQASLEVMDVQTAQLWFSGKEMLREKKLKDFLGPNEKSKVIVKLHKRGSGKPAREPLMSEDERKQLMLHAYRRQEELKVYVRPITNVGLVRGSSVQVARRRRNKTWTMKIGAISNLPTHPLIKRLILTRKFVKRVNVKRLISNDHFTTPLCVTPVKARHLIKKIRC